jgi:metal-responsive CopG/Arc/MetJ family transcriptional regulator
MKNVQISFDEELLEAVDEMAASSQLSRSAVVREALRLWIRQREVLEFERQWIAKLREEPQKLTDTEAWLAADRWSDD